MNRNVTVAMLISAVVLLTGMFALTVQGDTSYSPALTQIDRTQQFAISTPLVLGIHYQEKPYLEQSTRAQIYGLIQDKPGVHFRGICSMLGLSIGVIQYHLGVLVSAGFISVFSDGKMQRFFEAKKYSSKQMKIISLLRHKTSRAIIDALKNRDMVPHCELAMQLSITSQGLTWQMNKLAQTGLIKEANNGLRCNYFIEDADKEVISELELLLD